MSKLIIRNIKTNEDEITRNNNTDIRNFMHIQVNSAKSEFGDINTYKWILSGDLSGIFNPFIVSDSENEKIQENCQISNWDVSKVTNMHYMFGGCEKFNQPLNNWDVSNVTNMEGMFSGCKEFNQPLNNWNVGQVTNMRFMFPRCKNFNQPLNNWDVSNVTNMRQMFSGCEKFNQPLNDWDVSNVTIMIQMFMGCKVFNQPLNDWDITKVSHMSGMFYNCKEFNQNLKKWSSTIKKNKPTTDNMFYATKIEFDNNKNPLLENKNNKTHRNFIIFSNIAYLFILFVAIGKYFLQKNTLSLSITILIVIVTLIVTIISSLYHECDYDRKVGNNSIYESRCSKHKFNIEYNDYWKLDMIFANLLLFCIILNIVPINNNSLKLTIQMVYLIICLILYNLIYYETNDLTNLKQKEISNYQQIILIIPTVGLLLYYFIYLFNTFKYNNLVSFIISICGIIAGILSFIFKFIPDDKLNYNIGHSLWHILAALAGGLLLIPVVINKNLRASLMKNKDF